MELAVEYLLVYKYWQRVFIGIHGIGIFICIQYWWMQLTRFGYFHSATFDIKLKEDRSSWIAGPRDRRVGQSLVN